jgi:L1 cell adhesion molecule like protein
MSHKTTIRLIDEMSKDFDQPVKDWCSSISRHLWHQEKTGTDLCESSVVEGESSAVPNVQPGVEQTSPVLFQPLDSINVRNLWPGSGLETHPSDSQNIETDSSPSLSSSSHPSYSNITSTCTSESDTSSSGDDAYTNNNIQCISNITSYKLVGDNLDKYIRPRHEAVDRHSSSVHYFHSFAVRDRCDTSTLEDDPSLPDISLDSFSSDKVLPSAADYNALLENYTIIVARIIQKHIKFFKENIPTIKRHISHVHSVEMSQKSDVVPLGVLFKNETSHEDMIDIMSHLQQYVPTDTTEDEVLNPFTNEPFKVHIDKFYHILFGGDQLTVERAIGSKKERFNEARGIERLDGLLPVVEDWHAKVAFLKVSSS